MMTVPECLVWLELVMSVLNCPGLVTVEDAY